MAKKRTKKISDLLALNEVKTLAEGITSEKLSAMFFDVTKLKYQTEPLYRLDSSGHRYYYHFDANGEPQFFTSVTTMIKNTLPTSPQLIKWMADRGSEDSKSEAEERAHYGTFLHIQCGELLVNGTYDLDKLPEKLTAYILQHNISQTKRWVDDLKKDVLAFAQFMIDTNCKPLAIEICLYHPTDNYAGAIDIVAEIDWKKSRIRAIIDIKSGRKGFYETHEIQLKAYSAMWNLHFPAMPVDKVFNWSPKDWRNSPTYNFKDQTDSRSACKLPYLVALAKIEDSKRENHVTVISGNIDLIKGLGGNVSEYTFIELIKRNK
jgi:hypothetical protein